MECSYCGNYNDDNAEKCIICGQKLINSQNVVRDNEIHIESNDYKLSVDVDQFNPSDMIVKRKYKKKYTVYNYLVWIFVFLFFLMSFLPFFIIEVDEIKYKLYPVQNSIVFMCMLLTTVIISLLNFFMHEVILTVFSFVAFYVYVIFGRACIELVFFVYYGTVQHVYLSFYASVVFLLSVVVFSMIGIFKHIIIKEEYKKMPIY